MGVLAVAYALGGCGTAPQKVEPRTAKTVVLDTAKNETRVTTQLVEELTLVLPPPPEAGYVWKIFASDSRFLRELTDVLPAADNTSTVKFLAIRTTGPRVVVRVRFFAVRPNVSSDLPIARHEALINIMDPPRRTAPADRPAPKAG